MSPEVSSPRPPTMATPRPTRFASRLSWCGSSGASVATTPMIELVLPLPPRARSPSSGMRSAISRPTGTPAIVEIRSVAVVRLNQHPHREPAVRRVQRARCRADPALEVVADHRGPAADVALRHGSRTTIVPSDQRIEHRKDVLSRDVVAVDVVEKPVPRFGHNRRTDVQGEIGAEPLVGPGRQGVTNDPDAQRVGELHRPDR